jgi:integrase
VEVAAVTGARVSQLSRLEVQDLQDGRTDPRLMMPSSRKGRGKKKIMRRPVPIPAGLAAKLRGIVKNRPVDAALLVKPETQNPSVEEPVAHALVPWKKSDHSRPFARTVEAAGLNPGEVTINALRHSSIVRQLLGGVSVRVVAVNHDTSIVMIERTYSRHIGDHADSLARVAILDTTVSPDRDMTCRVWSSGPGLKGIVWQVIDRPRRIEDRPDRDRLAIRFEQFKKSA